MQDDETRCSIKAGMLDFFQLFGWFHSSLRTFVLNLFLLSSGAIKLQNWLIPGRTLLRERKKAVALH